jgi:AraC-like DNA-binding protein
MIDPLAEAVSLLQPRARLTKMVTAAGNWRVSRSGLGEPFYCAVLEGQCRLAAGDGEITSLSAGEFVLIPAARDFTMSGPETSPAGSTEPEPVRISSGNVRLGDRDAPAEVRLLVGHCTFAAPDAALLVSLLPRVICVGNESRLTTLVKLVGDEYRAGRPARNVVLARLLEVVFIEALRSTQQATASPSLLRGLADKRLAVALRCMHGQPDRAWTMTRLAHEATLSRSVFFERFSRVLGLSPMQYLTSWRMSLAKDLLRRQNLSVSEVAERVGYGSANAFSVAFSRHVGRSPARYAKAQSGSPAG